jgi:hypothetical protein
LIDCLQSTVALIVQAEFFVQSRTARMRLFFEARKLGSLTVADGFSATFTRRTGLSLI